MDKGTEGAPLGLTPILVVSDALAAINFYGEAFGAVEIARISAPDSRRLIHVRMRLFGSILVFMDEISEMAGKETGLIRRTNCTVRLFRCTLRW